MSGYYLNSNKLRFQPTLHFIPYGAVLNWILPMTFSHFLNFRKGNIILNNLGTSLYARLFHIYYMKLLHRMGIMDSLLYTAKKPKICQCEWLISYLVTSKRQSRLQKRICVNQCPYLFLLVTPPTHVIYSNIFLSHTNIHSDFFPQQNFCFSIFTFFVRW